MARAYFDSCRVHRRRCRGSSTSASRMTAEPFALSSTSFRVACGQREASAENAVSGVGEAEPLVDLVEQEHVRAAPAQTWPSYVVAALGVLERHVPRHDHFVALADEDTRRVCPGAATRAALSSGATTGAATRCPGPGSACPGTGRRTRGCRPGCGSASHSHRCPPSRRFQPLARLAAERIGLALGGVVVGERRDVDDAPAVTVLSGEEPAVQVVLVPAGRDYDRRGAGGEAWCADRAATSPRRARGSKRESACSASANGSSIDKRVERPAGQP